MIFPWNTAESLPRLRAVLLGALAATIVVLSAAVSAGAETVEGTDTPAAVEATAAAAEPETSAAAPTPIPVAAAPESVQTEEMPSIAPSPDSAGDSGPPVVPTPSEGATSVTTSLASTIPTAPVAPVDRALPRSAAIADSTAEVATKVAKQASADALAAPAPARRLGDLLDPLSQMSEEATAPTAPGSIADHPRAIPPNLAPSGLALTRNAIAPGLLPSDALAAQAGESATEKALSSVAVDAEAVRQPAGGVANAVAPTGAGGGRPAGGPAPSDLPAPAPESPASAPAGSGGTSFVPIAALLALLALAPPATLRRLGRAPDFQVPTRFVCALERPG